MCVYIYIYIYISKIKPYIYISEIKSSGYVFTADAFQVKLLNFAQLFSISRFPSKI